MRSSRRKRIDDILAVNPQSFRAAPPMRLFFRRYLLPALLLWPAFSQAQTAAAAGATAPAPPADPYEAVVPLTDATPAAHDAALREALATVLARVSGLADLRT